MSWLSSPGRLSEDSTEEVMCEHNFKGSLERAFQKSMCKGATPVPPEPRRVSVTWYLNSKYMLNSQIAQ